MTNSYSYGGASPAKRAQADMDKLKRIAELIPLAARIRDGFTYDPGHSDLDNEQPIHIRVTLGDWRALNFLLASLDATSSEA
jgi:hypothetical protein